MFLNNLINSSRTNSLFSLRVFLIALIVLSKYISFSLSYILKNIVLNGNTLHMFNTANIKNASIEELNLILPLSVSKNLKKYLENYKNNS